MIARQASNPFPEATVAQRGDRWYQQHIGVLLEPAHHGEYVVINVETGEFEVDRDHLAASDRAADRFAGAPLYATRVGSRTLGRIGARSAPITR